MCRFVRASSKSSGGGNAPAPGGESGSHRISSAGGSWGLSSESLDKDEARLRGGFSGAGSVGSGSGGESAAARTAWSLCCSSTTGWDDASRLCTRDDGRSGWVLLTLDSFGGFVRASVGGPRRVADLLRTVLASCDVLRMSVVSCGLSSSLCATSRSAVFFGPVQFLTATPLVHDGPGQARSTEGAYALTVDPPLTPRPGPAPARARAASDRAAARSPRQPEWPLSRHVFHVCILCRGALSSTVAASAV